MYSLTYSGLFVMIAGTYLVQKFGFSAACSDEITAKAVEYGPLLVGALMAAIGRYRAGGINIFGVRIRR